MGNPDQPSQEEIRERAFSFASEAMYTVALQVRRLGSTEPEDDSFVFRWWADLQFLIVALRRLRRAAQLASSADDEARSVNAAIEAFDAELPGLTTMRNVGEHIDAYAVDDPRRHHAHVDRRQLQVGTWDGRTYTWLQNKGEQPLELNVDEATASAETLYTAVRALAKTSPPAKNRDAPVREMREPARLR